MKNKLVRSFYFYGGCKLLLLVLFTTNTLYTQSNDQQIEFVLSNDKFADQDKYFSSGVYVSYQKSLLNSFVLPKTDDNKLLLEISVGNEIYTPTSLSSVNTDEFDRPFAGWLFGELEVGSIKENAAFFLVLDTGITGEESLSGDFQVGFHDLFGVNSTPTWIEQIEFKWLFNLKATYISNFWSNAHNALQYRLSPSLGTKDIFLENDISYFFGRLNTFQNSARIKALDTNLSKEFFGYISVGYRYVVHNTLIEGSFFRDDVLFTTDATNHILKAEGGIVLKSQKNTFKIIYNFNTQETPLSNSHVFGSLVYARRF